MGRRGTGVHQCISSTGRDVSKRECLSSSARHLSLFSSTGIQHGLGSLRRSHMTCRRLDMLPALLSEQLCSLRSETERLAVSVVWTLDEASLEVVDVWMGRTIIASRHQLSYQQAS